MADVVTSQAIFTGNRRSIYSFTNVSDGTGESAVQKIDISALPGPPTKVNIERAWWASSGMSVKILFDHTTDDTGFILAGVGFIKFDEFGGIPDPGSAGGTGDILFTTVDHHPGDTYSIVLEVSY
jgi:hypothetical protein